MKKYYTILVLALVHLAPPKTFAQNEQDALRLIEQSITGSARAQGSAGAFGAVGADLTSAYINPAGLALYRRNEALFGGNLSTFQSNTLFGNNTLTDTRTHINLPSWGIVGTKVFSDMGKDIQNGLVSVSFAGGMNRVQSFQQNIRMSGYNTQSSLLDYFAYSANGLNATEITNQFTNGQNIFANIPGSAAYALGLIDTSNTLTNYKALTDGVTNKRLLQQYQEQRTGGVNEYHFSGGANLSNMVYLGASLFIRHAYNEVDILQTENSDGTVPNYTQSGFRQEIDQRGTGVGGKFGIIARPIDIVKVGFAVQTPTRMHMRDEYKNTVTSQNTANGNANTLVVYDPNRFDFFEYEVISPAKLTASAAITFSKIGFVSIDVEHIDYSKMRMQSATDFFTEPNNAIRQIFTTAQNFRIGGELKIADYYRLRAGYALYETPFKQTAGYNLNRQSLTTGIGFLIDRIFIDAAFVYSYGKQLISPYTTGNAAKPDPAGVNDYVIYSFIVTGGIRF
ncbi:MAG: outer membrane protein transport protein [Bacteroidia bacterium]|jgi:hypothetical protein|nr:outer membrane protein transport protein [Bacteroidia bacterium]